MQPEYLEAMTVMKDMASKGYINKDFATLSTDKWDEPFLNGKGGIVIDTYSRVFSVANKYNTANPDSEGIVEWTGNLKNSDGTLNALPTDGYSSFLAIPKGAVKTEEELKNVLTFLDKLNEKECQILLTNGIEGKNFTVEDGKAVALKDVEDGEKYKNLLIAYSLIGMNVTTEPLYYQSKQDTPEKQAEQDRRQELMASDAEHAVFNPAASYVADTYVTKGVQLDQMIADARVKFVAGQLDEKGWEDTIELWKNQGGSDIMKEMNDLQKKAN